MPPLGLTRMRTNDIRRVSRTLFSAPWAFSDSVYERKRGKPGEVLTPSSWNPESASPVMGQVGLSLGRASNATFQPSGRDEDGWEVAMLQDDVSSYAFV